MRRFEDPGQQAQGKKEKIKIYRNSNKEMNALIEKIIKKFAENNKKGKPEKELQYFHKLHLLEDESKKNVSSVVESVESGEILSSSSK